MEIYVVVETDEMDEEDRIVYVTTNKNEADNVVAEPTGNACYRKILTYDDGSREPRG